MERLRKFLRLPAADRRLLVKALLLIGAARLGLWVLPFPVLRRLMARLTRRNAAPSRADPAELGRISWAVTAVSRCVPEATCLTQALATKLLLCWRGQQASLRIGVARSEAGQFIAHAWVESNGKVVIGGPASHVQQYALLPAYGEEIL